MRSISSESVIAPLAELIRAALVKVDTAAACALKAAAEKETSAPGKWALDMLVLNNEAAVNTNTPACQDCGQAVLFVNAGQDVHIGGNLENALNKGVERGYSRARKSVADSVSRVNTGTNTPAVIHYSIVSGDKLEVIFMVKGAGSENMSRVFMLTPSKGADGIVSCAVQTVTDAGANACPPVILGVGIGGTMEKCAILSKLALTRSTGEHNKDAQLKELEQRILDAVNATGVGAQGFGGITTALAVHVETCPTHIGMLPVAVNLQCHCARHGRIVF